MFKINLLVALRNLVKRKTYVIINTLGLSIGLASCIIISLFVQNQFSFDKSLVDADRIYRMKQLQITAGSETSSAVVPYSFARTLIQDYPEVEGATAFAGPFDQQTSVINAEGNKAHYSEEGVLLADSSFFKVLGFDLKRGVKAPLSTPNSVVLTKTTALKYFGEQDPLGKSISIGRRSCIITGICEDPPFNSHFKFSLLISSTSFAWLSQNEFNLRRAYCYLKLKSNVRAESLEAKFPEMTRKYVGAEIARIHNTTWDDFLKAGNGYQFSIQPVTSVHLDAEVSNGMKAGGNPTTLKVLIGIAILVFIIACINFMNLSTARSMERAREVGIRKVLGSIRKQLVIQFLTESLVLTTAAAFGALLISFLALPFFNTFIETQMSIPTTISAVVIFLLVIILVTLFSGIYPAFILSAYKPSLILKGRFSNQPKGKFVKNSMIIFQFWISIVLIISTLVIYQQVEYMKTKNLGFDKEQLLVIEGVFNMDPNYAKPFVEELKNNSAVKDAVGTLWVQGFQGTRTDEYKRNGSSDVITMNRVILGDGVGEIMDFKLMKGEFFSKNAKDSLSVIINHSAVKALGFEDPIGKKLTVINHDNGEISYEDFTIKGVIEDFHYRSLRKNIEPLVMMSNEYFYGRSSFILTKLSREATHETIAEIESLWTKHFPNKPLNWSFMDKVLDNNYKSEIKLTTIFMIFSSLSIIISAVGLLALLSYSIYTRRREISIRKVIGATISNIIVLLSKDFSRMIAVSFMLAIPISIYGMNQWLQGYAYRVSITLETFIIAGLTIALIAVAILVLQGAKAAKSKPVDVLHND